MDKFCTGEPLSEEILIHIIGVILHTLNYEHLNLRPMDLEMFYASCPGGVHITTSPRGIQLTLIYGEKEAKDLIADVQATQHKRGVYGDS